MKKILVVGDLHTKFPVLWAVQKLIPQYDKVIFLGDYVDDWDVSPEVSYNFLNEIIKLKMDSPEKVVLLLGNHDLSEGFAEQKGDTFSCSGYNPYTHSLVKDLYKTRMTGNVPIFCMSYFHGFLFTHAGVTNKYWNSIKYLVKKEYPNLEDILEYEKAYDKTRKGVVVDTILNYAFLNGLSNPNDKLFKTFAQVGSSRGGNQTPSPVWADKDELVENPLHDVSQIVGHTPVKKIVQSSVMTKDNLVTLTFCDTFSLSYDWYDGMTYPIGDNSLLEIDFRDLMPVLKTIHLKV